MQFAQAIYTYTYIIILRFVYLINNSFDKRLTLQPKNGNILNRTRCYEKFSINFSKHLLILYGTVWLICADEFLISTLTRKRTTVSRKILTVSVSKKISRHARPTYMNWKCAFLRNSDTFSETIQPMYCY